jgi:hypothetical protein
MTIQYRHCTSGQATSDCLHGKGYDEMRSSWSKISPVHCSYLFGPNPLIQPFFLEAWDFYCLYILGLGLYTTHLIFQLAYLKSILVMGLGLFTIHFNFMPQPFYCNFLALVYFHFYYLPTSYCWAVAFIGSSTQ